MELFSIRIQRTFQLVSTYRVKETFLRYYRNIVFSIKIKGDKTTPGADLGDNDFVGKPEIVSCEAIVYTKDGDGWIGAKIEKK